MARALPRSQLTNVDVFGRIGRILLGVALLFAFGYSGKIAETAWKSLGTTNGWALPNIEYVLWAIIFGFIIGNLLGGRLGFRVFEPGVATYEFWLKLGIVLLGVRFLLSDVLRLGGVSLALVVLELGVAIGIMLLFSRIFGLGQKLTALLAVGSSICGVSAIIATQGAIDADDQDVSFAIAAILALGAFGLFAYPAIGTALGIAIKRLAYGPALPSTIRRKRRLPVRSFRTRPAKLRW